MFGLFDYQLLDHTLIVGVLLFALGVIGFVARRSVAAMAVSAGVMLQGVALMLTAFGTFHGAWSGQIFSLLVLMLSVAAGVVVASVMAALARVEGTLDTDRLTQLGNEAAGEDWQTLQLAAQAKAAASPATDENADA